MEYLRKMKVTVVAIILVVLSASCATSPQQEEESPSYTKVFPKEYEETWNLLVKIMEEELKYPIQKKSKERGVIKTDWITVIRIRGTLRWNVKIVLDKVNGGTRVTLLNRVEEPSEVLGKMKNKRGEVKSGWIVSQQKVADPETLKEVINLRLGEQSFNQTH